MSYSLCDDGNISIDFLLPNPQLLSLTLNSFMKYTLQDRYECYMIARFLLMIEITLEFSSEKIVFASGPLDPTFKG